MATMEAPPRVQVSRCTKVRSRMSQFVDFTKEENVRQMRSALDKVRGAIGPRIRSDHRWQAHQDLRQDPFHQSRQAFRGRWYPPESREEHVEPAVNAALSVQPPWSRTSFEERASFLFRVADTIRERKLEFMAWRSSRFQRTGWKPMPMSPRPSISANSMPAKPCALPRPKHRYSCQANATRCPIFRSASEP